MLCSGDWTIDDIHLGVGSTQNVCDMLKVIPWAAHSQVSEFQLQDKYF